MAQLSHLMLFDPDPSGLDILTFGFQKQGCTVEGTADPAEAWRLVQRPVRALLVVNLKESDPSGVNLIRATASNPKTRNLACVAIGREDARVAALAAGAFVFLSVPVFVHDIINVCRLVAAATVPGSRPSPKTEISLELSDLAGVYFLLRALSVAGRSAAVELRQDVQRGELRFIDGSLSSAQLGSLEGLPALHRMLLWEDAALTFKFRNVARRGTQLSMKSGEITEECDRFLRDFAHEANELGNARTIYAPDMKNLQPSTAFPSEVLPLLRLFDGRRDLSHVLEESPFRIFDTLKIVKRFVSDQALRVTGTPLQPSGREPGPGLAGPSALDVWLQRQAPVLGVEVGRPVESTPPTLPPPPPPPPLVASGEIGADAPPRGVAAPGARPSSPFVAIPPHGSSEAAATGASPFRDRFEHTAHGIAETNLEEIVGGDGVSTRRPRTITQRERALDVPRPNVAAVNAATTPPVPTVAVLSANTPPPAIAPDASSIVQGAGLKQAAVVARGEIRIATVTPPAMLAIPAVGASVVIDMDPASAPLPEPSTAVPELPAHAPVLVAASAHATRPPSVIVAPMTPLPVLIERPRNGTPASGVSLEARRTARSPSDNFDALESDFFDREADLYKRESVESFEDLDGGSRVRLPTGTGPTRKP